MTAPDPAGALLDAMLAAWCRDINAEPLRPFEPDLLRGEHAAGHELAGH